MNYTGRWQRRTKIVCTIGPASGSPTLMERLLKAGMNVARLNLSHGTHQEHSRYIKILRKASERLNLPVAVIADLPGSKCRIGGLRGGTVALRKGAQVFLTTRQIEGDENNLPVSLCTFAQDVKRGDTVLVDDGALQFRVQDVRGNDVQCKVVVGGTVTPGRGVVVPGMKTSAPFLSDALRKHLDFAIANRADYIALSFVESGVEVARISDLLRKHSAAIPIICKIERGAAVRNFDGILAASDGIMVARGDLGVDIPLEKIPLVQKEIIRKSNIAGKPVITATQMLESMVKSASPTRAEVTDVANAIFDGTDAVMLSAETSVGSYPVEAVRMMARIAAETERKLPYEELLVAKGKVLETETDEAISYAACRIALQLGAVAIVAFTQSGSTARRVSKYRPGVPVLSLTPDENVRRRLLLYWGVQPIKIVEPSSTKGLFALGTEVARESGLARKGDLIVITGGIPVGVAGSTNLLKVERVV